MVHDFDVIFRALGGSDAMELYYRDSIWGSSVKFFCEIFLGYAREDTL